MKSKRTPKRIGELAELAFLHRATEKGLIVSHPYGDSAPFDFITLGNGKMCRVQVKCITRPHRLRIPTPKFFIRH